MQFLSLTGSTVPSVVNKKQKYKKIKKYKIKIQNYKTENPKNSKTFKHKKNIKHKQNQNIYCKICTLKDARAWPPRNSYTIE